MENGTSVWIESLSLSSPLGGSSLSATGSASVPWGFFSLSDADGLDLSEDRELLLSSLPADKAPRESLKGSSALSCLDLFHSRRSLDVTALVGD